MTNITYFYNTIRDDESVSNSSGDRSQRDINIVEENGHVAVVEASSSSSAVIGVNPKGVGNKGKDPIDATPSDSANLKIFSFKQLKAATRNFHHDCKLGEGRSAPFFKGWIDENMLTATKPGKGIAVAIKKLNLHGFELYKEWLTEVKCLGKLHHPNLVRLLGYCCYGEQCLLVYEYMPRGSLDNHLFRRSSYCLLSWNLRMKIALGAAKGLAFLHSDATNVIHRDVTSSNILLDSNYNAKLSDFGFANDVYMISQETLRIVGTYGYAAPESGCTAHLTAKSDVYNFGVVLLEMLSGRRAIDIEHPSRKRSLVEWAKQYLTNMREIFTVLDRHLEGQYSLGSALKAANLVLHCVATEAEFRPNMNEVVTALEQLQDSKDIEIYKTLYNGEHAKVDTLVSKLISGNVEDQRSAAGELRLLAKCNADNRVCIAEAGAIPLLVDLLSTYDSRTQEHAVTALLNLSICEENKGSIMFSGAVPVIVDVLETGSMEARENAAATLFSLSVVDENKVTIGSSGAIPALVALLSEGSQRGKKDAATALFNLCIYQGNKGRAVRAGVVPTLMSLLTEPGGGLVDEALAILAILAGNPEGKVAIGAAEAVPVLVEVIRSGSPRNKENGAAVLVHLCSGDQQYLADAQELGVMGPLFDMSQNGTDRGKRNAGQLLELMNY